LIVSGGGLSRFLHVGCRAATSLLEQLVKEPVGQATVLVVRTRPFHAASRPACMCSLTKRDERAHTYRSGRQAVASAGRRSLAAYSVRHRRSLLSSRYCSRAVLACVRLSVVASVASVVAAVRLAVARALGLGAQSAFIAPSLVLSATRLCQLECAFPIQTHGDFNCRTLRQFKRAHPFRRCTELQCASGECLLRWRSEQMSVHAPLANAALAHIARKPDDAHSNSNVTCRARTRTLVRGRAANAARRRAPGRHHWFSNVAVGGPLASARAWSRRIQFLSRSAGNATGCPMVLAR